MTKRTLLSAFVVLFGAIGAWSWWANTSDHPKPAHVIADCAPGWHHPPDDDSSCVPDRQFPLRGT